LRPECQRFISNNLEAEICHSIERLINTIGSPQIAIDERHTPKLYSRFVASLLAKHKRDGAARGRLHKQESSTPQRQQQPTPVPSSTSFATGVSNASIHDSPQLKAMDCDMTAKNEPMDSDTVAANAHKTGGQYTFDSSSEFTFGVQGQPDDLMDFTFDPITTPGNEDMLTTMQAIQNPAWWRTMMMPASVDISLHVLLVRLLTPL
jgi:hypothetical protein